MVVKSIKTAIYFSALSVFLCSHTLANGLVLQLNVETGELVPVNKQENKTNVPNSSQSTSLKKRSFQPATAVQPSKEVLTAIEATALKLANPQILASVNLTTEEWVALFRANIEIESGYNTTIVSSAGAVGLGQLMPDTAAFLKVDINNPVENLRGSGEYLLWLLESFGSPDLAVAAYNAGPEAVAKHRGVPPFNETREHVRKVLSAFFRLRKDYTQQEGEIQIVSQ
ncbi:lytic transglycosylase domain-containing protein [Brucella anthropi]|uniref:lytic transglycosylase domain-containing protein n=1 Tax=Brucella anthropi TaxID=529 RepID=UPI0021580887|nr:lytic transglycosylase domain-containing protein [Brucella anthropi]MCR8493698.1 lytic transglycosylase domain-containing protein [Brucella anthropi]